mmetsp:Transcript_20328/g.22495  ORF Transcript_20328/g.22495 Transcript_20328/m.22495 type:complete len:615 (+) Transcript_20328:71-1915(+)
MPTIVNYLPPLPEEERIGPAVILETENVINRKVFPEEATAGDEEFARRLQSEYDSVIVEASSETNDSRNNHNSNLNSPIKLNNNINNNNSTVIGGNTTTNDGANQSVATLSNPWEYDVEQRNCTYCKDEFDPFNRRHHCRLCGKIYCNKCSYLRALLPPSSIVLTPTKGGKKATPQQQQTQNNLMSFSPDLDPDRMLTYLDEDKQLLYGKGLEERFQLAREPLRVCTVCYEELQPLQEELRTANSNAMRFNHIDPTDPKRFLNSPLAFTLGHEVRKAAYTLNNLLPLPKRIGTIVDAPQGDSNPFNNFLTGDERDIQQCKNECAALSPSLSNLDGVQIPARLLEEAKGVAIMTVAKGGFGVAGVEFGTGLVVARLGDNQQWSAPCAIGVAGLSWGALIGAQVSDHVFLLMTDAAVELMFNNNGNLQLGADIGVAVGPVGRALEADFGAAPGAIAPIYTYSQSKGLYAGISLDGKVIFKRDRVNERFYGREVTGTQILTHEIASPPAARPLYDALQRCHVYVNNGSRLSSPRPTTTANNMQGYPETQPHQSYSSQYSTSTLDQHQQPNNNMAQQQHSLDYGDPLDPGGAMPPAAANDQHSLAESKMSDMTSDPGY